MKRSFLDSVRLGVTLLGIAMLAPGCTPSTGAETGGDQAMAADTLTRRQKDSIVSTLPIPGAGAVGKALRASDQALDRALAHDTIH